MLLFIDAPKFFRVFRLDETHRRARIGRIMKAGHEFREDEGAVVSDEERADIQSMIETLKEGDVAGNRAAALRFPETARLTWEYYIGSATDAEKRLIAAAAQEITRSIRKAERAGQDTLEARLGDEGAT